MRVAMSLLTSLLIATSAAALEVGDQAPDFSLADQNGTTVKLYLPRSAKRAQTLDPKQRPENCHEPLT